MHKQVRQDCGVTLIPKVERQPSRNQLDPSMLRYVEWLSTYWAEYYAEERHRLASSPSWTRSSSWRTSSSWTSDWHQHEWKDSAWSEKWQDEAKSTSGLKKSILALGNKMHGFEHQVESCRHHHLTAVSTFFLVLQTSPTEKPLLLIYSCLFFWISRPDSGNCPAHDGQC